VRRKESATLILTAEETRKFYLNHNSDIISTAEETRESDPDDAVLRNGTSCPNECTYIHVPTYVMYIREATRPNETHYLRATFVGESS
jgi:hypothetical protein